MTVDCKEKVEFGRIKPFPRGEGAPVRTLGRMRNGDISQFCMHLVNLESISGLTFFTNCTWKS